MRKFVVVPGATLRLEDRSKDLKLDKLTLGEVVMAKEEDKEWHHYHMTIRPAEMEFAPVSLSDDSAYIATFNIPLNTEGDIMTATVVATKRTLEVKCSNPTINGLTLESIDVDEYN